MKSFIIFFIHIGLLTSCIGQSPEKNLIDSYINKNFKDSSNVYKELQKKGKKAIPILIDYIDYAKKGKVGWHNPYSSVIEEYFFNNFKGIEAAYLIEFLLGKDTLSEFEITYEGTEMKNPFNVYGFDIIVKKSKDGFVKKSLTYDDMKEIKKIYRKWWNTNKEKSLNQLREDWQQKGNILTGSNFIWI